MRRDQQPSASARAPGRPRRGQPVKIWAGAAAAIPGALHDSLEAQPFSPQLAEHGERPPIGEGWIHEVKFDGYRMLATIVDGKAHLWSRNGLPWTSKVPAIARALERLDLSSAAFDGELIAGGGRRQDFGLLQAALAGKAPAAMSLVLFDLLHVDGVSIEACPLIERKALLTRILAARPAGLELSTHGDASSVGIVFEMACDGGYEGVVSKRVNAPYAHGRSPDWIKTKERSTREYAVVGFTRDAGARTGFSSLLLARREGHEWKYAGRVGTGFSDSLRRAMAPVLVGGQATPSVIGDTSRNSLRNATWFDPRFVVEIFYRGTSRDGLLRQPSFKGVRADRDVDDL